MMSLLRKLKQQNRVGKIKTCIILLASIGSIMPVFFSAPEYVRLRLAVDWADFFKTIVFYSLAIPAMTYFLTLGGRAKITRPKWSENPLRISRPMVVWQFISIGTICQATCMLIVGLIFCGFVDGMTMTLLSMGMGTYIGLRITLSIHEKFKKQ